MWEGGGLSPLSPCCPTPRVRTYCTHLHVVDVDVDKRSVVGHEALRALFHVRLILWLIGEQLRVRRVVRLLVTLLHLTTDKTIHSYHIIVHVE